MIAVAELKKHVGVSRACRALEVPRASYYRFDKPSVRTPTKSKRTHRRALSDREKAVVKTTLYSERFVDKSQETKSGLPETHGPQKPEASLTHPRLGYPSSSCAPQSSLINDW